MTNNSDYESTDSIWRVHNPEDALKYLKDPENFCPFSVGLTELMQRCGYPGSKENIEEQAEYLWKKLDAITKPPAKITVQNWFQYRQSRPSDRNQMFQICFALSASLEDTDWFFHHVCWERSFHCHIMEEAVSYYCLCNQQSYEDAQKLIDCIRSFPDEPADSAGKPVFTNEIVNCLEKCWSDEKLLRYFKKNHYIFQKWNITAGEHIQSRISEIRGRTSDKKILQNCENKSADALRNCLLKEQDSCSLVIQEYLLHRIQKKPDDLFGKTITSVSFMLERILLTYGGVKKDSDLPAGIRTNFPSKETFSKITRMHEETSKESEKVSYDSIRKCLILLEFYSFWVTALREEILQENPIPASELFDEYRDQTNYMLFSCGYGDLFPGNPYDWLFLWASATEHPLDSLRSVMNSILEEEE